MTSLLARAIPLWLLCVPVAMQDNIHFYSKNTSNLMDFTACTNSMLESGVFEAEIDYTTGVCDKNLPSNMNGSYVFMHYYEPIFDATTDTTFVPTPAINENYPLVFELDMPDPGVGDTMSFEFNATSGPWLEIQMDFDSSYINTTVNIGAGWSNSTLANMTSVNNTRAGQNGTAQVSYIFYSDVVQVFLDKMPVVWTLLTYEPHVQARFHSNFATCNRAVYLWRVQNFTYI